MSHKLSSSAVMAQRKEPHTSLDFFPTPPWATRALCEFLGRQHIEHLTCWEPACGEGHMARPLIEYFRYVFCSDVHDYGFGDVDDFLFSRWHGNVEPCDWIITNPPFRLAKEFALTALQRARIGVALLVRTQFLESGDRYRELFNKFKPSWILQFAERVPMHRGRLDQEGTTATAYCWVIWQQPAADPTCFHWIAPGTRARLEKQTDY